MIPGMARALNGKVAEGRASARRALLRWVAWVWVGVGGGVGGMAYGMVFGKFFGELAPLRSQDRFVLSAILLAQQKKYVNETRQQFGYVGVLRRIGRGAIEL